MSRKRQDDRDDSPLRSMLLLTLLFGSVLIIGGAALGVYVFSRSTANSTVGLLMPYNVELRPLPSSSDPGAVLPANVGPFRRKALSGSYGTLTGSASANYANGAATITVRAGLDANNVQAESDLTHLISTAAGVEQKRQISRDAGFFQAADSKSGTIRLIYVKQFWVFDVTANSQSALDTFMAAFPY